MSSIKELNKTLMVQIRIQASFPICLATGKLFIPTKYGSNTYHINVDDYNVPSAHIRFVSYQNPILTVYTQGLNPAMSVREFLQTFPSWDIVKPHVITGIHWTESDHNAFESALRWFEEKCVYTIQWNT
jgi:hypothetical protein